MEEGRCDVGVDRQWHWEQVKNAPFFKEKVLKDYVGGHGVEVGANYDNHASFMMGE